jgi:SAM-dependent methyltransferase
VLDVGCGIGGPARTLAVEFGCRVTGLDLTDSYVRAGQMLDKRVGLTDEIALHVGNALDMPFDDGSFDVVWMQHMAVNIEDKARLYHEAHRVLRPHGRLALHEILAETVSPPHYPVPWARDPSISFLVGASELRSLLTEKGFAEVVWSDDTRKCTEWYRGLLGTKKSGKGPIGLDILLGDDFREKANNVFRNLEEQRIGVVQAVFHRIG